MRKDIRSSSLSETQHENEIEIKNLVLQLLIVAVVVAIVNILLGLISVPINFTQVTVGGIMVLVLVYFVIKIKAVHNNIKNIETQINKLKTGDTN